MIELDLRACLLENHAYMEKSGGSRYQEETVFHHSFKGYIFRDRYMLLVFVYDVFIYSNR